MLLLRTDKLPEATGWQYEVKLDGYRAQAIKTGGRVQLRSRNAKDFTTRYCGVVAALAGLPDETVVDGEVVALDAAGKPVFSRLQNGWPVCDTRIAVAQRATKPVEPLHGESC